MCGIAGIISINPNEVSIHRLKAMTDSIIHRGPDGEGQWINDDGKVGFGHRRLSIIDLSQHANQPMHYMDRYTIVFNGEIYNYIELKDELRTQGYSFKTSSDTEVLMALYDKYKASCLGKLDGMFAFAIYDDVEKTVFCARDRFGEKPFHYHYEPGKKFIFGSEMKELWAVGLSKDINSGMLYNYLNYGNIQNPKALSETFYSNIKRLENAHYAIIDIRTLSCSVIKYWDIDLSIQSDISLEKAIDKFKELMFQSVTRRLRSDVPVGSSLSGGLDSSTVVHVIDQLNRNKTIHQKTFSARFPGFQKDESYYQQLMIDQTGAESYFTYPNADSMLDLIDKVYQHQEEPFGSASIIAQYEVFKLAKEQNVTVLLDGQGADEFLAGYHSYFKYYFLEIEKDKKKFANQWNQYLLLHSNNQVNALFQKDFKYRLRQNFPALFSFMKSMNRMFKNDGEIFTPNFYQKAKRNRFEPISHFDTLNGILKQSCVGGGLQELLRYADRNSMAHSREVRLPFLNHELVEFVFSLPVDYKIEGGWTKLLMRKAFDKTMPDEIVWRKEKVGYEPPQKKWMQQSQVIEMITEQKKLLAKNGILKMKEAMKPVLPAEAMQGEMPDWRYLMAGKLFEKV